MQLWVTDSEARALGCTHRARMHGVIPGFFDITTSMWVSRCVLLNPVEDVLAILWVALRELRGQEPDFMIKLGRPL